MTAPVPLNARRELFVDRFLVERLEGAALHLHPAGPPGGGLPGLPALGQLLHRLLQPDPGRGPHPALLPGGTTPSAPDSGGAASQTTNLAVSSDGIRFEQLELGLVEFNGTRRNNVLFQGRESHNFCVFLDANPAADPEQRFKAVGGTGQSNLHGFASPDGRRWTPVREGPLEVTGAFDSLNIPLWDPHIERYRLFSRYFDTSGEQVRAIQSCTSEDFVHWTAPQPHRYADGGSPGTLLHQRDHALPRGRAHPALLPDALPARAPARHRGHGLPEERAVRRRVHEQPRRRPLGPHLHGGVGAPRHRSAQLVPPQLHPRSRPGADRPGRVVPVRLGELRLVDQPPAPRPWCGPTVSPPCAPGTEGVSWSPARCFSKGTPCG